MKGGRVQRYGVEDEKCLMQILCRTFSEDLTRGRIMYLESLSYMDAMLIYYSYFILTCTEQAHKLSLPYSH